MSTTPIPDIFKAYDIRGLYGEQIDGELAELIGARVRTRAGRARRASPSSQLRVGLGRDMRLSAPELAARYRAGLLAEGVHVLDAGQVGSEMLYYLVGSRRARRRADVHRLAQPQGLHRREARPRGGDRAVGRLRHPGHPPRGRRRRARREQRAPARLPRRAASVEEVDLYEEFQAAALRFIDADAVRSSPRRLKVVVDGGNGMAGPMVGPLLEQPRAGADRDLLDARRQRSPTTSPTRCCRRTGSSSSRGCARPAPTWGSPGTATPTAASSSTTTGEFVDGDFLTALLAESLLRKNPNPTRPEAILYDVRASRAVPDTVTRGGRRAARQPCRPRLLQDPHARGGLAVRRRGLRALLLPRLLLRGLGHDPGAAGARDARPRAAAHVRAARAPTASATSSPGEINSEVADQAGKMAGDRRALRRRPPGPPRRHLDRLRGLALQRAPVQHRAAAAPVPGVAGLAARTWSAAATRCSR